MKIAKSFKSVIAIVILLVFTAPAFAQFPVTEINRAEMAQHNKEWGFSHKDGVVLALCGGGTKGLAHVGIMKALKEAGIPVAAIVGTSMGAIVGALFATGWTPEEVQEVLPKLNLMEVISGRKESALGMESTSYQTRNNSGLFSINLFDGKKEINARKGILSSKDLYRLLQEMTSRVSETDFNKFPIPFAAIAVDLQNGDVVRMRSGNVASAMRASMSIPGLFEPWERDGRLLVDGGLKANLPVIEAKKMFPGHPVIALNLSPRKLDKPKKELRGLVEIAAQSLEILLKPQIDINCRAADVVVQVDCTGLGVLDSDGYDEIIERGHKAAVKKIDEIRTVLDNYHKYIPSKLHTGLRETTVATVKELSIIGVPKSLQKTYTAKYSKWLDKPLDMAEVAEAVKDLSEHAEISKVEPQIKHIDDNTVRIELDVTPQPKYEIMLGGYSTNLNPDRWLSLKALAHSVIMDGDSAELELRGGSNWAIMGRYFTALSENDFQFGLTAAITNEYNDLYEILSDNNILHVDETFKRTSIKAMLYKNLADDKIRLGVGYAFSKTDAKEYHFPGTAIQYALEDRTAKGIVASIGINSLNDPIVPTKGFALMSDIWFPHGQSVFSRTMFTAKLPLESNWVIDLSGGLNTASFTHSEDYEKAQIVETPYAASIGPRNELWTLASDPIVGEQAYWAKLSATKVFQKTWWGGLNTEFFAAYGATSYHWNTRLYDAWEAGIQISLPTNIIPGSIVLAYGRNRSTSDMFPDRDKGEFVIGYTLGIPKWWKGILP